MWFNRIVRDAHRRLGTKQPLRQIMSPRDLEIAGLPSGFIDGHALAARVGPYLAFGNLPAVDALARATLAREPNSAVAAALLCLVTELAGQGTKRAELARGLAALPRRQPMYDDGPRYLVIKAWGCGFWSDVHHLVGALLVANITGRLPITLWGNNSLYSNGGSRDVFTELFMPTSMAKPEDLFIQELTFAPYFWSGDTIFRNDNLFSQRDWAEYTLPGLLAATENVVVSRQYLGLRDVLAWAPASSEYGGLSLPSAYRKIFSRYIVPRPEILTAVDKFVADQTGGKDFIAVHIRGLDKSVEQSDLATVNASYEKAIASLPTHDRIFVMSDDDELITRLITRFGARIFTTRAQRGFGEIGLHLRPDGDGLQLAREVVFDFFVAMRASFFVGNVASNVSAGLALAKKWKPGRAILFGQPVLSERFYDSFIDWNHKFSTSGNRRD